MAREYDLTIGMFKKECRFHPQGLATVRRSLVPPDMPKLYVETFQPERPIKQGGSYEGTKISRTYADVGYARIAAAPRA